MYLHSAPGGQGLSNPHPCRARGARRKRAEALECASISPAIRRGGADDARRDSRLPRRVHQLAGLPSLDERQDGVGGWLEPRRQLEQVRQVQVLHALVLGYRCCELPSGAGPGAPCARKAGPQVAAGGTWVCTASGAVRTSAPERRPAAARSWQPATVRNRAHRRRKNLRGEARISARDMFCQNFPEIAAVAEAALLM